MRFITENRLSDLVRIWRENSSVLFMRQPFPIPETVDAVRRDSPSDTPENHKPKMPWRMKDRLPHNGPFLLLLAHPRL
ncbi:hypothetical protein NPIL_192461 [Nephila pilipes]|uniref:Uncharacterized protein n=1 Tax=Nephila pilipes TaxID=299642 RepID=A0A8X6UC32_NEPPI|nr:hypothetical protein NPIL_192461 [Nephila pilipes]